MASTYSNLGIELIGTGDQSGTWGTTTNTNLGTALEEAIVGTVNQAVTAGDLTLPWSTASNATQVARHLRLNLTGSSGGASNLIVPTLASGKNYIIKNSSDTAITVKTAAGTGILVPAGESRSLYQDGTDVVVSDSYHSGTFIGAGEFTTLSASGAVTGAGFTARFATPGPIGNTLADTGAFTTLSASSTVSGAGVTARFATPGPIGNTLADTGAFTTLSASSTVSGTGVTARFASPGPIGNTLADTGAFTTLAASSTVSGVGVTARFASPGPIGNTLADTGAFTSLSTTLNLQVDGQGFSPTLTLTDAATITWDTNSGQVSKVTLAGNRTMAAPTNLQDGGFYSIQVIQDGTGSRTLAWNAIFKWNAATAPTLSTTAAAVDFFNFRSDGTNLYEQGQTLGVS
jgi:hypothetical protein